MKLWLRCNRACPLRPTTQPPPTPALKFEVLTTLPSPRRRPPLLLLLLPRSDEPSAATASRRPRVRSGAGGERDPPGPASWFLPPRRKVFVCFIHEELKTSHE
ncbi:hypothetical protein SEVIR_3G413050v4 [Setaria viridis]